MIFSVLLIIVVFTGCGQSKSSNDSSTQEISYDTDSGGVKNEMLEDTESSGNQILDIGVRKLIRNVNLNLETKDFDLLLSRMDEQVNQLGGYVENSDISGNSYNYTGNRFGTLIIRIPSEGVDAFLSQVTEIANVTNKSETIKDVTLDYVDTESHIKALKIEQDSLLALMEKAEALDDIIKIQSRLTDVRYELENYESQLRTYDNLIDYSTITLLIEEVERITKIETSFWGEIKVKLIRNLGQIGDDIKAISIWLVSSLPYFIIWGILIGLSFVIIRKVVKKSRHKSLNRADDHKD